MRWQSSCSASAAVLDLVVGMPVLTVGGADGGLVCEVCVCVCVCVLLVLLPVCRLGVCLCVCVCVLELPPWTGGLSSLNSWSSICPASLPEMECRFTWDYSVGSTGLPQCIGPLSGREEVVSYLTTTLAGSLTS